MTEFWSEYGVTLAGIAVLLVTAGLLFTHARGLLWPTPYRPAFKPTLVSLRCRACRRAHYQSLMWLAPWDIIDLAGWMRLCAECPRPGTIVTGQVIDCCGCQGPLAPWSVREARWLS